MQTLTVDALADAVRACIDEPAHRQRAADLARRLRAEDGAAVVLEVVDGLPG
jgi:sterol 3beta-glucosyltransferase